MQTKLDRDKVMESARLAGLIVEPCAMESLIGIRAYQSDSNEAMRMGSNGAFYTRGDDGWMYQIGTVEDVAKYVETLK
jgi:hypothetical protein